MGSALGFEMNTFKYILFAPLYALAMGGISIFHLCFEKARDTSGDMGIAVFLGMLAFGIGVLGAIVGFLLSFALSYPGWLGLLLGYCSPLWTIAAFLASPLNR